MKENELKASDIANFLELELYGTDYEISGVSSYENLKKGTLFFFNDDVSKLDEDVLDCTNLAILGDKPNENISNSSLSYLVSKSPRNDFAKVLLKFFYKVSPSSIADTAQISTTAEIGNNVSVGEYTVIGNNVTVGSNTILKNGVVISDNCQIGENCVIESNTVIGEEGFGFEVIDGEPVRLPHISHVRIGDNVEIGACTVICRGTIDPTIIENGAKIDGSVFIAHNVKVGRNAFVIANSIICGSAEIGESAWISPLSTVKNKVKVGKNSLLGLGAVALKDLEAGGVYIGNPAKLLKK